MIGTYFLERSRMWNAIVNIILYVMLLYNIICIYNVFVLNKH